MLKIENAVHREWRVSPCYVQLQWVLETGVLVDGTQLYLHSPSRSELQGWIDRRNAESAAAKTRMDDDLEFREEVVAELMDQGKAWHVALNLTNTPAKLLEQARLVGVV